MTMNRILLAVALLAGVPTFLVAQQTTGRSIGEVTVIGDLIHLEMEPGAVMPAREFDLDYRTLRFTPEGDGYRVENLPLRWDADFGVSATASAVTLRNFAFPFSGERHHTLHLGTGALTFAHPAGGEATSFDMERYVRLRTVAPSFVGEVSGIAAFLKPRLSGDRFVRELSDRVIVTWVLSESPGGIQSFTWEPTVNRIQVVLHESGVIDLSYNEVSARDAIVGVFPMVDPEAVVPDIASPQGMDFSSVRPADGPFPVPFEAFHWSERPSPQNVACSVIEALGDRFDFIASYSDFRVDDPEGGTPMTGPRGGDVTGIGRDTGNLAAFCSEGQLQAMYVQPISTAAVQQHERSPDGSMTDYDYAVSQIAHELGHRWAAFATAIVDGEEITLGPTHWATAVHLPAAFPYGRPYEADIMGGSTWHENPDGTFTQLDRAFYNPAKGWSWLALYLMGLAPPEEVPPFFILRDLERLDRTDTEGRPIFQGDKVELTVDHVIDAMGPRTPPFGEAQTEFNTAIVVITEPGEAPTEILLHNANNIREKWIEYWDITTGGRSSMTADPR